ncbi:hypothetical protein FOA52_005144 [Chlamydomonas sp. UWO 241]|nr:hypothetical protein FOA52_005144 [Chlamydomonas sp. UWO 241]
MRAELGFKSLLLSKPYCAAMAVATGEYWLELWLIPGLKQAPFPAYAGLCLVLLGEAVRKVGMLTAQASFTHMIRRERQPSHVLVTWGIYRFVRHPGYLGWAVWAVGTQVMLANPLSAVLFVAVVWRFFSDRIPYEERHLRRMFPEYEQYALRTPTWMPFIEY